MKTNKLLFCLALSLATPHLAHAQWTGQGEAGFVSASGNTDSETINLALKFKNEGEKLTHDFSVGTYQASSNNVDSAESLSASYGLKYALTDRSYLFGELNYLDDEFDGFTEQTSLSVGYGYKVIDTEPTSWELGIGAGYRDTSELIRLDDGTELEGKDLSGETLVFKSDFRHQLTPTTEFIDAFVAEIGSDNSFIENDASLIVSINDKFALKAGLLVRHNTDPAPGAEETDTITSVNLVYNFN